MCDRPDNGEPASGGQACLLDGHGAIVWVNELWRRNGSPLPVDADVGDDYARTCQRQEDAQVRDLGDRLVALLTGARDVVEVEYVCRHDGAPERRFLVRAQALRIDGARCAFLLHEDVTEARQAAAALHASEERYRQFFEAAPDAVFLLSADEQDMGRILDVNTAGAELHGYRREELLGRNIADLDVPDDAERVVERISELKREGSIRFRAAHRRRDGGEFPVEVSARVATVGGRPCVITFNRDVSERHAYQTQLRDQDLRLGIAARASHIGFWSWNVRDDTVAFSDEWKAQLGYAPDELRDGFDEWRSRLHPEDAARVQQLVADYLAGRADEYETEFRLRHKDGSYRWIYVRGEAERDAAGNPTNFVGCHVDVTAQRIAEQGRAELAQRMAHMQRLEAIGTLAGGIAHDFNNILSIIGGNAQLALEEATDASMREMLTEIHKAGDRARALVRQILAFSRREQPRRAQVALERVLAEVVGLLRSTTPQSISLHTRVDAATPDVLADSEQLHQVFVNLGTNAWHAIGDGPGTITFTVRPGATADGAPAAVVEVHDDGAGMSAETRQRIFEPFFTTKPSDRGTGLGLSAVHGIVQAHGGAIEVDSEPGVGATFRVVLPAAGDDAPAAEEQPAAPTDAQGRILLVDDEPTLLRVLTRGLTRTGYEVVAFTDPEQALAALAAAPASFDAFVTDYDMPGMNGAEAARRARALRAQLPIVLCSGFLSEFAAERALAAGATCILSKPVLAGELASRLTALCQPTRR